MKKTFKVALIGTSPSYSVKGDENTTLETVWDSQKCLFAPGTKVLIQDENNNMQMFEKKREY